MAATDAFYDTLTASVATVYVALYTTAPTDADPGVEVTGGSYARQQTTMIQDAGNAGLMTNSGSITFGPMPTCDVVAVGFFDSTNTNLLDSTGISTKHFDADDTGVINTGQFSVTFN